MDREQKLQLLKNIKERKVKRSDLKPMSHVLRALPDLNFLNWNGSIRCTGKDQILTPDEVQVETTKLLNQGFFLHEIKAKEKLCLIVFFNQAFKDLHQL